MIASMRRSVTIFLVIIPCVACGEIPSPYVIAGPSAPSRVAPERPLTWDSREELLDWVTNGVTRGPITIEGQGATAFIRVRLDFGSYVVRGPDLDPAAVGVRGARIRARLVHDRPRPPQAVQTERFTLYLDVANPQIATTQSSMYVAIAPSDDWQDLTLSPGLYCCREPLAVRYAYVPFGSTTPATLDIDLIEFLR